jgi:putative SOS response-associated peptidase YedK
MCGRVRLGTDFSQIRIKLKFDQAAPVPNVPASWNVCPTDPMLVAVNDDGKRIPQQMRWGLVPWWAKDINRKAAQRGRELANLLKVRFSFR